MNRQTTHVVVTHLAFPGVQTRAHPQAKGRDGSADSLGARDGPARAHEGSEEAVAERFDRSASEALELVTHRGVRAFPDLAPPPSSQLRGAWRRPQEIGEQTRG